MSPAQTAVAPTTRQMSYLRSLALKTGTSFTYPRTRGEASQEINRLRGLKDTRRDVALERDEGERERFAYATAVQDEEVSGYGSTATWRVSAPARPAPGATRDSSVGERTELARYEISDGERVLYGQRINGTVRVTDRPARGQGRSYLVERELEKDGYSALKALIADYVAQARELDEVPMASSVIRHQLQQATHA
jgi:hypothetical protein